MELTWLALTDPRSRHAPPHPLLTRRLPLYTTKSGGVGGSQSATPSPTGSTKSRSPTPTLASRQRGSIGGSMGGSPTKHHPAFVGDLLVSVRLVPDRPPCLRYRRPWREAGRVLALPPQLLLPESLRGSLVGAIAWFVDGLLAASETLRVVPRRGKGAAAAAAGGGVEGLQQQADEEEEMVGVPKLSLFQKLFYLTGLIATLASVSLGAGLALAVAACLFPVATLLVAGSLLAVVGLGLPAFLVLAFIVSAPPVRRRLLEPAILKFGWTRALFLEAAPTGDREIGMEEEEEGEEELRGEEVKEGE
jgi:hypothetical protein